jgi:Ca2+-binding RTX toxin-like protein
VDFTLPASVENLTLTGSDPTSGTGNSSNNMIIGNAASNVLAGNAGNDSLDGGAGADSLMGGSGDDAYTVDNPGDSITESAGGGVDMVSSSASDYTLAAEVENLTLAGTASINGTGNSSANTIQGNSGNNQLFGMDGNDSLAGGNGDDWLDGGLGNDNLDGGLGNDTYAVDSSNDVVTEAGSAGTDTVKTTLNAYSLGINLENLTFVGLGNFSGTGNAVANTLTGGTGNDSLDGGAGIDTLFGGPGDDTYIVDVAGDVLVETAGQGTDTVRTALASYVLGANLDNLVYTGAANFTGTGNADSNQITGGNGVDNLNGGAGADVLLGGLGNDSYTVDNAGDVVSENPGSGTDTVNSSITYTLGNDLENLVLTGTLAINGTGNTLNNVITGNSAANTLYGLDGNDSLNGGAGIDRMVGGLGNDTYTVDNVADQTDESVGEGTDVVNSSVTYTLGAEVEKLTLTGTLAINGTGNGLANVIIGNTAANSLYGMDGNDSLSGGTGADTMFGGLGDDTYTVDNTGDTIGENSGEGTDQVNSSVTYTLPANAENLTLTGAAVINGTGTNDPNILIGNAAANSLVGNGGGDTLNGGAGADIMSGGAGNDAYMVDNALDTVNEAVGGGTDTVQSSVTYALAVGSEVENVILTGAALNATGNEFDNSLTGNGYNNILNGGTGGDAMAGGAGNDTYVVDNPLDTVTEAVGAGTDLVQSSIDYVLGGDLENLTLTGTANLNGTGNDLANSLTGNSGNNILDGGAGKDTVAGGLGDDTYKVNLTVTGTIEDTISEAASAGTDTVVVLGTANLAAAATLTVGVNQENYDISGTGATLLNLTGGAGSNTLVGNDAANLINGATGADTMTGGKGNDIYTVDDVGDGIVENPGEGTDLVNASVSYTLPANVENLTLTGTGNLNATGNSEANTLTGNSGVNTLDGGAGIDIERGGAGNDTFIFRPGETAGDSVLDFFGNGTLAGDALKFIGFGAGASLSQVAATDFWSVSYGAGLSETLQLVGVTSLASGDYVFA